MMPAFWYAPGRIGKTNSLQVELGDCAGGSGIKLVQAQENSCQNEVELRVHQGPTVVWTKANFWI